VKLELSVKDLAREGDHLYRTRSASALGVAIGGTHVDDGAVASRVYVSGGVEQQSRAPMSLKLQRERSTVSDACPPAR